LYALTLGFSRNINSHHAAIYWLLFFVIADFVTLALILEQAVTYFPGK
jgi:hypothetical protein